ncbi:chaperone ATPase hsp78 [Tulasnella sp. JGI-2019a]|nr:chaperone ATPase hsp78 [Tulasnella sp. JGI-2019a]
MSEYHDRYTIARLIGSAPGLVGYDEGGQLTEAVRRRPYAVLLLDEIEKAHPEVSQILLQILDEGSLTDSHGRKVDFKNTIIILTSNLGSNVLSEESATFEDGQLTASAKDRVIDAASDYFAPELLNRLDSIQVFNKLSKASIMQVVGLRLKEVVDRLADRRIVLDVDEPAREWLAKEGYSDQYGARAIARVVRTKVLFPLAKKLLTGTIRNGDRVTIRVVEGGKDLNVLDNHPTDSAQQGSSSTSK